MIVLQNMGLIQWDQVNDIFSHQQLAANFGAIDVHDHTPGKGKLIPAGGLAPLSVSAANLQDDAFRSEKIASGAITTSKLADGAVTNSKLASSLAGTYRTISFGFGILGGSSQGIYTFRQGSSALIKSTSLAISEAPNSFAIASADYAVSGGINPKLRLRVQCAVGTVAPAVTLTAGLYALNAPVADLYNMGSVIAGSTASFVSPSTGTLTGVSSSAFSLPSDGSYLIGISTNGSTTALSSPTYLSYQLQCTYV